MCVAWLYELFYRVWKSHRFVLIVFIREKFSFILQVFNKCRRPPEFQIWDYSSTMVLRYHGSSHPVKTRGTWNTLFQEGSVHLYVLCIYYHKDYRRNMNTRSIYCIAECGPGGTPVGHGCRLLSSYFSITHMQRQVPRRSPNISTV